MKTWKEILMVYEVKQICSPQISDIKTQYLKYVRLADNLMFWQCLNIWNQ